MGWLGGLHKGQRSGGWGDPREVRGQVAGGTHMSVGVEV